MNGSSAHDLEDWLDAIPPEWKSGCATQLFDAAYEAHRSPGRHYHAWSHVQDCVEKLRTFRAGNPRAVFAALLFHDAVYVTGQPDNEERSAELAAGELAKHSDWPQDERDEVTRMILATKHHRTDEGTGDVGVMLDIDMSILGADAQAYRRYAEGVMREWVPAVTGAWRFRFGRRSFLKGLLRSERIFSTDEGVRRWEAAARRNIASEIAGFRE